MQGERRSLRPGEPSDKFKQTQNVLDLTDGNLTAVCLVGLVGAVRDAVTLWVDLGDAGGGAALEVSAAVRR